MSSECTSPRPPPKPSRPWSTEAYVQLSPHRYGGAWGCVSDPSGLQQLGARFYWPEIGRFVHQDPLGDGMNWYAYVGNNPVTRIDPSGLWSVGGEAYLGIGGGLILGWDSCTGPFMRAKVGAGIGAGVSFDLSEQSPGRVAGIQGHGSSFGMSVTGQVQPIVLGWSGGQSVGLAYDAAGNEYPYAATTKPSWKPTLNWPPTKPKKLGLSISATAEGALF